MEQKPEGTLEGGVASVSRHNGGEDLRADCD